MGYLVGWIRVAVVTLAVAGFCAAAGDAQAEGKLRDMLHKRVQEKMLTKGDALDDNGDSGSCAERAAQVNKALAGPMGKRAFGPAADIQNLPYGTQNRQVLDVYYTKNKNTGVPAPVIVMVHGGGWCTGDKALKSTTENKLAHYLPKGFMFVSVNYPMLPHGSDALDQGEHIAQAIAFVQQNAQKWGGDPSRVILMGHSAGAHLVSLVNADAALRTQKNVQPVLATVSLDSGAVDVVTQMPNVVAPLKARYKEAFGTVESGWIAASPFHQLDSTARPWLGVCSTTRPDDPCGQAKAYVSKSRSLGVPADSLPLPMGHGALNKKLGEDAGYTKAVDKFLSGIDPVVAQLLSR